MKKLMDLLFTFICVTTCVVFVTAMHITVFTPQACLGVEILWQMLAVSFLTSLGVYFYPDEASVGTTLIRYILHYIYCNAVVLGCGLWFGWFDVDNLPTVFGMLIAIAFVFFLVSAVVWNRSRKEAALMNERLKGYQQEGEDERTEQGQGRTAK